MVDKKYSNLNAIDLGSEHTKTNLSASQHI